MAESSDFPAGAELRLWYTHSWRRARLYLPCGENQLSDAILTLSQIVSSLKCLLKNFLNFHEKVSKNIIWHFDSDSLISQLLN